MSGTTIRVRFAACPRKTAVSPPLAHPLELIVQHEDGWWSVWHDTNRFPSRAFAQAVAVRQAIPA